MSGNSQVPQLMQEVGPHRTMYHAANRVYDHVENEIHEAVLEGLNGLLDLFSLHNQTLNKLLMRQLNG